MNRRPVAALWLCALGALLSAQVQTAGPSGTTTPATPSPSTKSGSAFATPVQSLTPPPKKTALTKDETVFAILDPTGAVKSVIVSDWIHSDRPGVEIKDRSNLTAIENVKGFEIPRRVGDSLIWKLDGSDLYYRGKSSRSLPLAVTIKYWLDGKAIEPSALAGKSGLVRVRVEVKNLAAADKVIDGVKRRIFAPLITIVGLDLPATGFRDVQITNGRLITDGQNNIAVGILIPGLKESIVAAGGFGPGGIDLSPIGVTDIPIPDTFEFSAKVDKFRLGSIFVAATPDFPEIGGPNTVGTLDDALAQFQKLADASRQIKEGSAALAAGAKTLKTAVGTAVDSVRPLIAENQDSIGVFTSFIANDEDIRASRELLATGDQLNAATPTLIALLDQVTEKKNQAALAAVLADAKKINAKDLLGAPKAKSVISEEAMANFAESLVASDSLYRSMDDKRLLAAAKFAEDSRQLFDALSAFDRTAVSYSSGDGTALKALGGRLADFDRLGARMGPLASLDASVAAQAMDERTKADQAFLASTAFLDEQASASIADKLASGAPLSSVERASLASLLGSARTERDAIRKTTPSLSSLSAALPVFQDGARLALDARPGVAAALSLGTTTLPGLEGVKAVSVKNEEALAGGRKILDPATVKTLSQTLQKIIAVRKTYEKNRTLYRLAETYLSMRLKNGGFKGQIELIDSIQQNLDILAPLITLAQDSLSKPEIAALIQPQAGSPRPQDLLRDLVRLQPLMKISRDALQPEKLAQARAMVGNLPELGKGVEDLVAGSALLSDKLQELAAGTKMFDEEGIQKISSLIVDKAKVLRGFLKVKDALSALSRDYKSFSGAPDGASTSLKFIFKTDEIK